MRSLRCNEQIRLSPVRLIDGEGQQRGVVPTDEALRLARDSGLDLVEVSPTERPPVCKIMDYGKFKYTQSKKSKQKHHETKIKEVRLRPKTDPHDRSIKLKHAREFLEEGHRVQFTMRFKGRERMHREIGMQAFQEFARDLVELAKIERPPMMLGQRMTMVLVPLKLPGAVTKPAAKSPAAPRKDGNARPAASTAETNSADAAVEPGSPSTAPQAFAAPEAAPGAPAS